LKPVEGALQSFVDYEENQSILNDVSSVNLHSNNYWDCIDEVKPILGKIIPDVKLHEPLISTSSTITAANTRREEQLQRQQLSPEE